MNFTQTKSRSNPQFGIWENETFIVEIKSADNDDFYWMKVKRQDGQAIHSWADLQAIKNNLIGPEHEGIEIYPAESRLVDESNAYHLWVYREPGRKFGVGLKYRRVKNEASSD